MELSWNVGWLNRQGLYRLLFSGTLKKLRRQLAVLLPTGVCICIWPRLYSVFVRVCIWDICGSGSLYYMLCFHFVSFSWLQPCWQVLWRERGRLRHGKGWFCLILSWLWTALFVPYLLMAAKVPNAGYRNRYRLCNTRCLNAMHGCKRAW